MWLSRARAIKATTTTYSRAGCLHYTPWGAAVMILLQGMPLSPTLVKWGADVGRILHRALPPNLN